MNNKVDDKQVIKECCDQFQDCCTGEVGTMVQKLVRMMQLFERDQIKPFGFTTSQCYVLIELQKSTELTMNELSDRMNLNTSTMTRIVNNLVRDGLIERSKDKEDRRVVVVGLTKNGFETANKLQISITDYYRKIVSNLPSGQVENVLESVSLLIDAFDKANPNCC